ncbi:MAG: low molecular weight phosphotyrosine protein phosphatase, partial [Yaniella sp.]|nr:low molecular weight phosphotyrosine protein phosphatase [Yaniella sp.]
SNMENLLAITENDEQRAKIIRFGAFGSTVDRDGIADVPDPYGNPEEAFVDMYNQIEDAVQGLVKAIQDDSLNSIKQRYGNQ